MAVFDYDRLYAERINTICNTITVGILEIATLETLGMLCSFDPFPGARLLIRIICHKFVKVDDIKWTDFQSKLILFYFYCCTVHFDDSVTFLHQLMHLYIYILSITKTLCSFDRSYMFRHTACRHHQGAPLSWLKLLVKNIRS
jgi:hypothetical protein